MSSNTYHVCPRITVSSLLHMVSTECSLGVDVQADVVLLVDGSYSIGLANFAKVRAFLEVLVKTFDIGATKVQISLVQYSRDPHTEFYLNTHHDQDAVVKAVRTFPYRGGSTNTGRAMTYVREKIFLPTRGARPSVPRSSDAFKDPATRLRNADVEIFAVGVKEAVRSELVAIANTPADTHVYTVDDFDAFERISKELTQSICLRIEQELRNIQKRSKRETKCGTTQETPDSVVSADSVVSGLRCLMETQGLCALPGRDPPPTGSQPVLGPGPQFKERLSNLNLGPCPPELPAPRSLSFSEVGSRSFRATWETDTPSAESYVVQFRPADDTDGHFVSVSVPGDTLTSVLPHLTPETRYEVNVLAQYAKGDSFPVTGYEKTLEEQGPVRGLRVSEETTDSFRVSWLPAPGAVVRYRLSYEPVRGDNARLDTLVPGGDTASVLRNLLPQTKYRCDRHPRIRVWRRAGGPDPRHHQGRLNLRYLSSVKESFLIQAMDFPGEDLKE
ncbi:Collagen alpha-1(XII) chain [Merluccius polli]|uniref:Collagen alpha-1(XII) chain n=1 Tax=Merluccius polli TaxID=89951 RepID=A0AA47MTN9_MERPO|nr:Collagen alpha-1(XII) chain [Merluccius polli]